MAAMSEWYRGYVRNNSFWVVEGVWRTWVKIKRSRIGNKSRLDDGGELGTISIDHGEESKNKGSDGNADQEKNKCVGPINRRIQAVCKSIIC